MRTRTVVLTSIGALACSIAGAFVFAEYHAQQDRDAAAATCGAVQMGVPVTEVVQSIRTLAQVRFDGDFGGKSVIVALSGPAYCYCKLTLGEGGVVTSSKGLCQH